MLLLESHVFTCEELKQLLIKIMIIKNAFYQSSMNVNQIFNIKQ